MTSMPHVHQFWMFSGYWSADYRECADRSAANLIKKWVYGTDNNVKFIFDIHDISQIYFSSL